MTRFRLRFATAVGLMAIASVAAPGALAAPHEPNDSFNQATGPMVGGQAYDGTIETSNDVDYFYFNTTGQRQIDVSMQTNGRCFLSYPIMYDSDGERIAQGSGQGVSHILHTAPSAVQYVLQVEGNIRCEFSLRVDPADAITTSSPGIVAHIGGAKQADDLQRVYVDGQLVGSVHGTTGQAFTLGVLPPTARITFEAHNAADRWSWNTRLTNQDGRVYTTVFTENQSSGSSSPLRVGVVRRVVMTPTGGILESCGEALASVSCIVAPAVPARPRHATSLTLRRRGKRYGGTVSSEPGCVGNRRVSLRRVGAGNRTFGTAYTRPNGRFTIRRALRLRGRVYAVVAGQALGMAICRSGGSGWIRG